MFCRSCFFELRARRRRRDDLKRRLCATKHLTLDMNDCSNEIFNFSLFFFALPLVPFLFRIRLTTFLYMHKQSSNAWPLIVIASCVFHAKNEHLQYSHTYAGEFFAFHFHLNLLFIWFFYCLQHLIKQNKAEYWQLRSSCGLFALFIYVYISIIFAYVIVAAQRAKVSTQNAKRNKQKRHCVWIRRKQLKNSLYTQTLIACFDLFIFFCTLRWCILCVSGSIVFLLLLLLLVFAVCFFSCGAFCSLGPMI